MRRHYRSNLGWRSASGARRPQRHLHSADTGDEGMFETHEPPQVHRDIRAAAFAALS